jgi:hypothetical protein
VIKCGADTGSLCSSGAGKKYPVTAMHLSRDIEIFSHLLIPDTCDLSGSDLQVLFADTIAKGRARP